MLDFLGELRASVSGLVVRKRQGHNRCGYRLVAFALRVIGLVTVVLATPPECLPERVSGVTDLMAYSDYGGRKA